MEALKKAIENRKTPFVIEGKAGGRIISLRVSEKLEQILEEQAQEWGMSISDTLRSILNFYFLPPLLYEVWDKRVDELVEKEAKGSSLRKAQLTEKVFCDMDESEEYALFIQRLWEQNLKYWEILREEALAMNKIAEEQALKTAEGFSRALQSMKEAGVEL